MVCMSYNIVVDSVVIVFVEHIIDDPADDAGLADFGVPEHDDSPDLLELGGHPVTAEAVNGLQGLIQLVGLAVTISKSSLIGDLMHAALEGEGHTLLAACFH